MVMNCNVHTLYGIIQNLISKTLIPRCNYQLQLEVSGLEIYTERSKVVAPLHPITNAAEAWSKRFEMRLTRICSSEIIELSFESS